MLTVYCPLPLVCETEDSMTMRSLHAPPDVHDIETPDPLVLESEVKRMNMLPDVAVNRGVERISPLSELKRVPDVDVPS